MKREHLKLSAFVSGTIVPIEAVPDFVFADCLMGDGLAIEPEESLIRAPCAGRVLNVHPAQHSCSILTDNGVRILLHVGLDTVQLLGHGFTTHVAAGDLVEAGQALIGFDPAALHQHGKPTTTILTIENSKEHPIVWRAPSGWIAAGDTLLHIGAGKATAWKPVESAHGWARVRHARGLHARPSAMLATAIKPFMADVNVIAHGARADARSAAAVMSLAIGKGEEVELEARGENATQAIEAAIEAIGTPVPGLPAATPPVRLAAPKTLDAGQLPGIIASPGLAIGEVAYLSRTAFLIEEHGLDCPGELAALEAALAAVIEDIAAAEKEARRKGLSEEAEILAAHRVLAGDPELLISASYLVALGKSAAFALQVVIEAQCAALGASGNTLFTGRASDLRDIEQQVQRKLAGAAEEELQLPPDAVVIAEDLLLSDFPLLVRAGVKAILTVQGGSISHVAILARTYGIPMLVALGPRLTDSPEGIVVIVDAERGLLETMPSPQRLASVKARIERRDRKKAEARTAGRETLTSDGVRIEIAANVSDADEAREAVKAGAESVGLLYTERLFVNRQVAPDASEQCAGYQAALDALEGRSAIIRTLDIDADKSLPYVAVPAEENPALGLRGIRLGLMRENLLVDQLRAILSVRPLKAVKIMLPMITECAEVAEARLVLDRLSLEMGIAERPQLGVLIDTPAAAVQADLLAVNADFFSVATNELTQYALCMDGRNPALTARLDGLHPGVLRLVDQAAQGAARKDKWIGACGATASDPLAVPLLIGLGVTELSVSPAVIPGIKALVRRLSLKDCQAVARSALQLSSSAEVRSHVRSAWPWLDSVA